ASSIGGGDGASDVVTVTGTAGNNHVVLTSDGTSVVVSGLPEHVTIAGAEPGSDSLVINSLAGNDSFDVSAFEVGAMNLTIHGGDGTDTFVRVDTDGGESFALEADGGEARFAHDGGGIDMDGVGRIQLPGAGGRNTIPAAD